MTSLTLLNLFEFRLLIVEMLSLSSNQETTASEKLIRVLFSPYLTDPFILLHLYVTK